MSIKRGRRFCLTKACVHSTGYSLDNSTTCEDEAGGEDKPTGENESIGENDAKTSEEPTTLSISLPRHIFTNVALQNLKAIIQAKGTLLKRAFGTDSLDVEIDEEKVTFPWFTIEDAEATEAYTVFVEKLYKMAVKQKRVALKEKDIVNEKYEFRCFLLRLGMIGDEYKQTRKILMRNLTGSAAFLTGSAAFKSGKKMEVSATSDEQLNEGALKGGEAK